MTRRNHLQEPVDSTVLRAPSMCVVRKRGEM